ncbi:hypothetical protein [Allohahella marinimesophila]|uniref:Uncharacterized protein n=1 Tax=Allohahella marinimesophila TaxID=1054972 RepID=A0ABP7P760_9GAMM
MNTTLFGDEMASDLPSILVMYGCLQDRKDADLCALPGENIDDSYPVEIGVMRSDGDAFCALIQPCKGWKQLPESASNVHYISPGLIDRHGVNVEAVAEGLNRRFSGLTLYSEQLAQHKAWLDMIFDAADIRREFDVVDLASMLTTRQKDIWPATARRVRQMLGFTRQRASSEARILQTTFHWSLNNEAFHSDRPVLPKAVAPRKALNQGVA